MRGAAPMRAPMSAPMSDPHALMTDPYHPPVAERGQATRTWYCNSAITQIEQYG
jgi:hypothetical protein